MATDAEQLDEREPEEVLEDLRRECVAYVAEHYEHVGEGDEIADEDYSGTNHDPEHVWDEALEHVLGPTEWWEKHSGEPRSWTSPASVTWTEQEAERYVTVFAAWAAVAKIGMAAGRDLVHQDRLFGSAAERPEVLSPEWTAMYALGQDEDDETPPGRFDIAVANYLSNVRGGLVDATGMFYDLEDDEEDTE